MSSSLFQAYVTGEARRFFGPHPFSVDERRAAVRRAVRPLEAAVASGLTTQNARYASSAARETHLDALRSGAAAVVTGQQVGLFLGPLYTIYKAATAVRVAQSLSQESGQPVVPIFWLQTEDHDLVEIASCAVSHGQAETLTLSLPADPHQRVSIAHHSLPASVIEQLSVLRTALAHLPHANTHLERLERHYRAGVGWADAFAHVLAELFADDGLVLIDPRDRAFGVAAARVHRTALRNASPIADALAQRVLELEAAGYEAAIAVRPKAPLAFFHPLGATGARYRLEPAAGRFAEVGGNSVHSLEELCAALDADPLSFSTSALLRPILQDTLLPTAAYVGGPGEVAYFAQMAPLYAAFDLAMPLVVPRARFRVVDDRARRLLERWRLTPADAERSEDALLAHCHALSGKAVATDSLEQALLTPFCTALEQLTPQLVSAGPGVDVAIEKTRDRVKSDVSKLLAKYQKASIHRDAVMVDEVRRLRRLLFPENRPQERTYGLASFAARFGERAFIDKVLASVVPFDAAIRDLA